MGFVMFLFNTKYLCQIALASHKARQNELYIGVIQNVYIVVHVNAYLNI